MSKITVIGSINMDAVATMERFPLAGETVMGKTIGFYPGGKGTNQCISIARLGGDVEMIGMVGNDANGDFFKKMFLDEGVETSSLYTCDKPTAMAQIEINAEGQNRICVIPSANYEFGFAEIDLIDEKLKNTELIVLQLEMRLDVTEEIIRRAHNYGTKILLNPAPAAKLSDEVISYVDYITPNETELSLITGMPTDTNEEALQAGKKLINMGVKCVVATLGSKGALLITEDCAEIIKGYKVKALDTVAAGDSFNGALAVALIEGKSVNEAIGFANAMGALTVTVKGAIPSIHKREDVDIFMRENKPQN